MRKIIFNKILVFITLLFIQSSILAAGVPVASDALPSWKDGPIKQSIIQFVERVTDKSSPHYVAPEDRIATFDNDGTLWVEQPVYTQAIFSLDRIKALVNTHPEFKTKPPFSVMLKGKPSEIGKLSSDDFEKVLDVTHSGMTGEEYKNIIDNWFRTAIDPHFKQPYTALVYQPMLEVMRYLSANGFKVYIVTGGGHEFVRAFAPSIYHVEPENVIGSVAKTKYTYQNNKPVLVKLPDLLLITDHAGKPEAINLFIGKKPLIAFGNSDGDREMLEWITFGSDDRLAFLVHHDDAKREYAYDVNTKVGTFSEALMKEAKEKGWGVISMKNDWKVIFNWSQATS